MLLPGAGDRALELRGHAGKAAGRRFGRNPAKDQAFAGPRRIHRSQRLPSCDEWNIRDAIGVLPRRGWMLKVVTFFVPAVLAPGTDRARRAPHWAGVFGRLAPGVTAAQAQSELLAVKARLNDQYPVFKKRWGVMVQPLTDVIAGVTRTPMLLLLGAVSVVLLIACANVANLLLARSCHRQQELAVRAALGASGARLVRQVLTENLVLTLLGGAAGVLLAYGGSKCCAGSRSMRCRWNLCRGSIIVCSLGHWRSR